MASRVAGRFQRWVVNPAKEWADDYKRGFNSVGEWLKESPTRAMGYSGLLGTLWYTASNNITEAEYHAVVAKNAGLVADVPPKLRNPVSEEYISRVNEARLGRTLRQLDLIVLSVFYVGDYPLDLKVFKAQHYFFHDFVRTFQSRVTEVSVLGATPMMTRAMVDYDYNEKALD